jgi:photosystem II stability/assembly factor-like uncharacterized protein
MRQRLLTIIFVFALANELHAQDWISLGGEAFRTIQYGAENYWIGSQDGKLLRSPDGLQWESVRHLLPNVYSIVITNSCILASGSNGAIERSTDTGKTWQSVSSGAASTLLSLCSENGIIVACGGEGVITRSTDDGRSWQIVDSKEDTLLTNICFANARIAYCSSYDGAVLKSEDSGLTWKKILLPGSRRLSAITTIGDSIVLAADANVIFRSRNAGETWDSVHIAGLPFSFLKAMSKLFLNATTFSDRTSFFSTDSGQTWQKTIDSNFRDFANYYLIYAAASNGKDIVRVGSPGLIQLSSDTGASWNVISLSLAHDQPFFSSSFGCSYFFDSLHGQVFGDGQRQMTTTDGGITWQSRIIDSTLAYRFPCSDARYFSIDSGVVATESGMLYYTTDGGNRWNRSPIRVGYGAWFASNTSIGFMTTDSTIWKTYDRGVTWTRDTIFPDGSLGQIQFPSTDTGYLPVSHGQWPDIVSVLLRSTDGGKSWPETVMQLPLNSGRLYFRTPSVGYFGLPDGRILRTHDAGATWDTSRTPTNGYIYDILMVSDSVGYAAADTVRTILSTHDGGVTWQRDSLRPAVAQDKGHFVRLGKMGNDVIAVGDESIYKLDRTASATQSVVSNSPWTSNPYLYISIYPNPVNTNANVTVYGLYSVTGEVQQLHVRDVLGRDVLDLSKQFKEKSNGSTSSVGLDVSSLPSGVYMVVLETTSAAKSRSMIVVH